MILKHNWEPRTHLSTISGVRQLDDDHIVFYRRLESTAMVGHTWEQVIMDRANKTCETRILGVNMDMSAHCVERTELTATGEQVHMQTDVHDVQGNGTGKVEIFKNQIVKLLKTMQFVQWAAENEN